MALTDKLTAIADATREKTGESDKLTLDAIAEAIRALETGGGGDIWGGKIMTGSFVLAEETTSTYTVVTKSDLIANGVLSEESNYRELGAVVIRKPTSELQAFSNYKYCWVGGLAFPSYVTSGGGGGSVISVTSCVDKSGYSSVALGNGVSLASDGVRVLFSANYKGTPDFTYQWVVWGIDV